MFVNDEYSLLAGESLEYNKQFDAETHKTSHDKRWVASLVFIVKPGRKLMKEMRRKVD